MEARQNPVLVDNSRIAIHIDNWVRPVDSVDSSVCIVAPVRSAVLVDDCHHYVKHMVLRSNESRVAVVRNPMAPHVAQHNLYKNRDTLNAYSAVSI